MLILLTKECGGRGGLNSLEHNPITTQECGGKGGRHSSEHNPIIVFENAQGGEG